jgi:heptosyltransferase-3
VVSPLAGHRVERDFKVAADALDLKGEIPGLVFDASADQPWAGVDANERIAVIHPSARWEWKRWQIEKWLEVGRFLATRFTRIVISCGPDEQEIAEARAIAQGLGPVAICTGGMLSWPQLAWLLRRAGIFVGVDTAAMHLAAACGTPTVALFGASVEHQWRPWRVLHKIAVPWEVPFDPADLGYLTKAEARRPSQIEAEKVISACNDVLQQASFSRA